MRFFTQADEVFDGDEATREAEDHVDRDEAPKLKPGEGGTINAKPHRLTDNDVRFGGHFVGEAFMEKVNDGKDGACERHEGKDKKSPAGPDVGKRLCDNVV